MAGIQFLPWGLLLIALALYALAVLALIVAGRHTQARALAGFIPDCLVMMRRLLARPDVSWWERAVLVVLIAYLATPIDLVPDFVPVAGQLDDAVIVALAVALFVRRHGPGAIREAWPGPQSSLRVVLAAGGHRAT